MAKVKKLPVHVNVDDAMRKRIVDAMHRTWNEIAPDAMQLAENGVMTGDLVQELVSDAGRLDACGKRCSRS
jgi:hypothetical protein